MSVAGVGSRPAQVVGIASGWAHVNRATQAVIFIGRSFHVDLFGSFRIFKVGFVRRSGAHTHPFAPRTLGDPNPRV